MYRAKQECCHSSYKNVRETEHPLAKQQMKEEGGGRMQKKKDVAEYIKENNVSLRGQIKEQSEIIFAQYSSEQIGTDNNGKGIPTHGAYAWARVIFLG